MLDLYSKYFLVELIKLSYTGFLNANLYLCIYEVTPASLKAGMQVYRWLFLSPSANQFWKAFMPKRHKGQNLNLEPDSLVPLKKGWNRIEVRS